MEWEQTFRLAAEGFQRHAPADLWHGRILASDFANPWPLICHHEPLARLPCVGTTGPQGPYRPPDGTGRYFGDPAFLRMFRSLADGAVRALEQSPLAGLMTRVCRPPSSRDWSDCWVGLLYCFAEDGVSHLIQAQEREATLFGPIDGGAEATLRVTMFAFRLLPLAAACTLVPPGRGGNKTHLSTLLRWITRGVRAIDGRVVRLEACRLGSRWMTSREALQRFSSALTLGCEDSPTTPAPRTPAQRGRAAERASRELEQMGV